MKEAPATPHSRPRPHLMRTFGRRACTCVGQPLALPADPPACRKHVLCVPLHHEIYRADSHTGRLMLVSTPGWVKLWGSIYGSLGNRYKICFPIFCYTKKIEGTILTGAYLTYGLSPGSELRGTYAIYQGGPQHPSLFIL